ncbi:hypothetical protein HK097_010242 [Rhizophlyctis rosea]|uniref:ABC3 transporter permease C-terminal domain-containing protein n=1 Tax=Rhizophlyctis rosea TaxID=64517 RepID=A0AAD5SA84_9FUNG|nr:hypothetical protein HK097_010242 [Rhizophlyctis rosea]
MTSPTVIPAAQSAQAAVGSGGFSASDSGGRDSGSSASGQFSPDMNGGVANGTIAEKATATAKAEAAVATSATSVDPLTIIPADLVNSLPPNAQDEIRKIASLDDNGDYAVSQNLFLKSLQSSPLSVTYEFTVIDAIESPYGKYPPKLGNVALLGYKSSEHLLHTFLNTTLRNDPNFKLAILALEAQRNAGSSNPTIDSDTFIAQLQGNVTLTDNVMSVIVIKEDAAKTYVKGQKARRRDIIGFSNDVAMAVGLDVKAEFVAPVWTVLESTATMQIYLQEAFFTVVVILSFLAVILIYSLLLTDVESKTFQYGMLRTLGLRHKNVMGLLICQAAFFAIPGISLGLLSAYLLHIPISHFLSSYASSPLPKTLSPTGIILGTCLGIILPLIGMLHPIRRALSKTLREALDLFHSTVNDTIVVVQRLEKIGMKPLEASVAAILFLFGFTVYYIVPLTFMLNEWGMFFRIMTVILLAMVLGSVLVGRVLQPSLEILIARVIVMPHDRPLTHIVLKNLASHGRRNRLTALMFTLCLAYIIFVAAMFNVQTASVKDLAEWTLGADVVARAPKWSVPLPEDKLRTYFEFAMSGTGGGSVIEGYSFLTFQLSYMDFTSGPTLSALMPINDPPSVKLYGVEPSLLDAVMLRYYDADNFDRTIEIPPTTPSGKETPNIFDALSLTLDPRAYGMSSDDEQLPPPQIVNRKTWGVNRYSKNRTELYTEAIPIIISSGMKTSAQIYLNSLTKLTLGYYNGGPYRVDKTFLCKPIALLEKLPGFLDIGSRSGWNAPIFVSMGQYEKLMRLVQNETKQEVMERSPKEVVYVRVREGATKAEVDAVAADLVTVIGDGEVKVTTALDETGSTGVATGYITVIFYIVSAVGVLFSFFVLWLSFTANIHENAWEFGVLRSIGFPVSSVIKVYIYESLCIMIASTMIGTAVGLLVALAVTLQLNLWTQLPFHFYFPTVLYCCTVAASFVVSLLGSYLPARNRAREKIAVILKGE